MDNLDREVRVKPGEMLHMQELIKYALPAVHGWHAMYNSAVVAPAKGQWSGE